MVRESDIDRRRDADLLVARLRAAQQEFASTPRESPDWRTVRERLSVLLGELEVVSRHWVELPLPGDDVSNRPFDKRLRRLVHARLESEVQIRRARRLLERIRDTDDEPPLR